MRLIDADELKELIGWTFAKPPFSRKTIKHMIDMARTVDAEPVRHGKWIRENNYGIWKCSECGCKINRRYPLKGNIWNYYYCPNCGAKMDERKEE